MTTNDHSGLRKVLTLGEPLVVFVPNRPGRIDRVEDFRPLVGGAEFNTAVGLARLGVQVSFAGGVGDDPLGERIMRAARIEGIDINFMEHYQNTQTALLLKQWVGLHRNTSVYYYRNASPMGQGLWSTYKILETLDGKAWNWVHTTGITCMLNSETRNQTLQLLQALKKIGVTSSFDVNVRLKIGPISQWIDMLKQFLPWVDWFFVGDEEAVQLFGEGEASSVYQSVCDMGFKGIGIVLKRGAQGAQLVTNDGTLSQSAFPVDNVIDTVGAGDGFNAGFIAGLLKGMNLQEALTLGAAVGAFAVTSVGDNDGYPTYQEAVELVGGGKELLR